MKADWQRFRRSRPIGHQPSSTSVLGRWHHPEPKQSITASSGAFVYDPNRNRIEQVAAATYTAVIVWLTLAQQHLLPPAIAILAALKMLMAVFIEYSPALPNTGHDHRSQASRCIIFAFCESIQRCQSKNDEDDDDDGSQGRTHSRKWWMHLFIESFREMTGIKTQMEMLKFRRGSVQLQLSCD